MVCKYPYHMHNYGGILPYALWYDIISALNAAADMILLRVVYHTVN